MNNALRLNRWLVPQYLSESFNAIVCYVTLHMRNIHFRNNYLFIFQVRRIMPGSVSEADGRIQVGDLIYSVNGNVMKDLSHPAALQILKHSGTSVKIVVFRDKKEDIRLEQEKLAKTSRNGSEHVGIQFDKAPRPPRLTKRESRDALIPGSIGTESRSQASNQNRPILIRHSTIDSISSEAASSMGIPHLEDGKTITPRVRKLDLAQQTATTLTAVQEDREGASQKLRKATSMELSNQKKLMKDFQKWHSESMDSTASSRHAKSLDEHSAQINSEAPARRSSKTDDDDDDDDSDFDEGRKEPLQLNASLLTFGHRSETQAFVIEYQRMFKGLGIKVMLDEDEVMITEVTPSGLVGKDGNIR